MKEWRYRKKEKNAGEERLFRQIKRANKKAACFYGNAAGRKEGEEQKTKEKSPLKGNGLKFFF